jgi:hypothetical protein
LDVVSVSRRYPRQLLTMRRRPIYQVITMLAYFRNIPTRTLTIVIGTYVDITIRRTGSFLVEARTSYSLSCMSSVCATWILSLTDLASATLPLYSLSAYLDFSSSVYPASAALSFSSFCTCAPLGTGALLTTTNRCCVLLVPERHNFTRSKKLPETNLHKLIHQSDVVLAAVYEGFLLYVHYMSENVSPS